MSRQYIFVFKTTIQMFQISSDVEFYITPENYKKIYIVIDKNVQYCKYIYIYIKFIKTI